MQRVLHETCQQYIKRRLSEGWRIVGEYGYLRFLSPPDGKFIRPVDIRNDIETLRPDAVGDETNLEDYPAAGDNYDKVDEAVADDHTTRVQTNSTNWLRDFYNVDDHSVGSGTINSVKVYARTYPTGAPSQTSLKIAIKAGTGTGAPTTVSEGSEVQIAADWNNYDNTWTTNPATSAAFTWDEIDKLQIGVALRKPATNQYTRCTQVYVEVDYTAVTTFYQNTGQGTTTPVGVLGLLTKTSPGAGSITPSGVLTRLPKIQMGQGSITPSGVLGLLSKIAVGAGSITPTGALSTIKRILKSVGSGTITPVGTLGRKIATAVGGGNITPTGVLGRLIKIAIGSGTITPAGALSWRFLQLVGQGTITPLGGILSRAIKIAVGAGSITPSGALTTFKRFIQTVGSGVITPTGALSTMVRWAQSVGQGTITPVGTLGRNIFIAIGAGTITPIGTLGRKIAIAVGAGSITPTGALSTIQKAFQNVGQGTVAIAGTLGRFIKVSVGGGTITPVGTLLLYYVRKLALWLFHRTYRDVVVQVRPYRDVTIDIRAYRDVNLECRG